MTTKFVSPWCATFSVIFATSSAVGYGQPSNSQVQPPTPPTAPLSLSRRPPQKPTGLSLELSGGLGVFSDLKAPLTGDQEDIRLDGTSSPEESTEHQGFLLSAKLGYTRPQTWGGLFANLGTIRSQSATPAGSPAASYTRYELEGGGIWSLGSSFNLLTASDLRRSMFRNADSGHYVDAVLIKIGGDYIVSSWKFSAYGAVSVLSRLGYIQNSNSGSSGPLKGSESSTQEFGARLTWKPIPSSDLFAAWSQEQVIAKISELEAYESFGLRPDSRFPSTDQEKLVKLNTTVMQLGAVRRF